MSVSRLAPQAHGSVAAMLSVTGEADLYNAGELESHLAAASAGGATRIVVDLTGATFIDSTTLGVLVAALRRARHAGGELALAITDRNILKIFEITGLDGMFAIHASAAEAMKSLG